MKTDENASPLPADFIAFVNAHPVLAPLAHTLTETAPSVSVRVNRSKGISAPSDADRVAWNDDAFYLDSRPRFTFDPALHQGLYYVQDASSTIISRAVKLLVSRIGADSPLTYLDACAAPGGKTTASIDALPAGSTVFANEYDPKRLPILIENLRRWGTPDIVITRGDTSRYAKIGPVFDIIATDVPCSGEGMFRKEPQAVAQWSPALTRQCAALQREIVENVWNALKPGGYLIYSTCTFNRLENEENIQWIVDTFGAEPIDLSLSDFPGVEHGIDTTLPCARFIPGAIRGEGLFIAVLRRPDEDFRPAVSSKKNTAKRAQKPAPELKTISQWLDGDVDLAIDGETVTATSPRTRQIADSVARALNIVAVGTPVATLKANAKKSIITPTHQLALSTLLRRDAFPSVEVDYTGAIDFLRRQTPCGYAELPAGYVLLTYGGHPLGFIKNLGTRANSLMPNELRILSSAPTDAPIPNVLKD